MPVSGTLMLALLAMDSYNRGYLPGLDLAAAGASPTDIGSATLRTDVLPSGSQAAGFFAQAYTISGGALAGKTVISYRGTDNPTPLAGPTGASDILSGWVSGVGIPGSQVYLAEQFYNSVTGTTFLSGPAANTILTGHSLGGGLAGYMAALSGTQAQVFDAMPFGVEDLTPSEQEPCRQ